MARAVLINAGQANAATPDSSYNYVTQVAQSKFHRMNLLNSLIRILMWKIGYYITSQETFARITGYCEQNDIYSPHVTVYESLLYSAWLRLPSEVDDEKRKMFVNDVLELAEMDTLKEALVGLPGVNGLSIEQRKRLTIAVELVSNPSIIFMDEPTSGLDARAAAIVMRTVRNTVDTGRTVVCTIHQPSMDIFEAFDEAIEGISKNKDGYNPATWMLELTASSQETRRICVGAGITIAHLWRSVAKLQGMKAATDISQKQPVVAEAQDEKMHKEPQQKRKFRYKLHSKRKLDFSDEEMEDYIPK
ncbi:hypothetical protein AgCh_028200 [Apium graveolens]